MRTDLFVPGVAHETVQAGDVALHCARAGQGPLVLLLHGFPEFWWSWRHQLQALAAAGFTAVAPDLRGYGGSDRPTGLDRYRLGRLAGDVAALATALGAERVSVVGHDWGGAVAWTFAERFPDRLERLAILNAPHPLALARGLLRPDQLVRSAYMALFQVPLLPERLLAFRDAALLRRALRASRTSPVEDRELDVYVAAARAAGDLRGGLDYYRAMGRGLLERVVGRVRRAPRAGRRRPPRRPIEAPVLVIWGEKDPFLGRHLARPPAGVARDVRVELLPEAGHSVQLDAPWRVNEALIAFLRAPARP